MKNFLSLSRFLLFILFVSSCAVFAFAAPSDLDTTFGGSGKITTLIGTTSAANAVAVQSDGKIVVAGESGGFPNRFFTLVRYNNDGSLDTSFDSDGKVTTAVGTGGSSIVYDVAIQADGKIVAAGSSFNGSNTDFAIARYNTDGSLDTSFDGDGKLVIQIGSDNDDSYGVVIQPNGKIVLAGGSRATPNSNFALVRLNVNGSFDTSFDSDGIVTTPMGISTDGTSGIALQTDGKVVVTGRSNNDFAVVRYNSNGSLDTSFDGDGKVTTPISTDQNGGDDPGEIAVQADGKIVVAGFSDNFSGVDFSIVRYNTNGSLDTSFNGTGKIITPVGEGNDYAYSLAIQSNGKIVVAGGSNSNTSSTDFALIRYNPNGSLDTSFDGDGKVTTVFSNTVDSIQAIAIQSNGRIVAVGRSNNVTFDEFAVARYMGDAVQTYRAPFDFDGDSKTDIAIFRPSGGEWWINRSATNQTVAAQFGASSDKPVPADYTGDGKADIAFYRPSSGQWFILRSEDATFYAFPFGASEDIPAPGDFDADGKTDQAVFRPSQGAWYIKRSSDNGVTIQSFGIAEDKPVVADYDGDGKADIAVFRLSSAQWWILKSTSGLLAVQFGQAGDKAVVGDYTGDGKGDIGIFRPTNGFWYILRSEDFSYYGFPFGLSGDIPAPGDFDGDGKTDAAVFRPSNSGWYLNRSTAGFLAVQFGTSGDQPIPNSFVR